MRLEVDLASLVLVAERRDSPVVWLARHRPVVEILGHVTPDIRLKLGIARDVGFVGTGAHCCTPARPAPCSALKSIREDEEPIASSFPGTRQHRFDVT